MDDHEESESSTNEENKEKNNNNDNKILAKEQTGKKAKTLSMFEIKEAYFAEEKKCTEAMNCLANVLAQHHMIKPSAANEHNESLSKQYKLLSESIENIGELLRSFPTVVSLSQSKPLNTKTKKRSWRVRYQYTITF